MSPKIRRNMMYSDSDTDSGDEKMEIFPTLKSYSKQLWDLFSLLQSEIIKIDCDVQFGKTDQNLKELEMTIDSLEESDQLYLLLQTASVKLKKKYEEEVKKEEERKKEEEKRKESGNNDSSSSASSKPAKRRKIVRYSVQVYAPTKLKTLSEMIEALVQFGILYQKKVEYMSMRMSTKHKEKLNEEKEFAETLLGELNNARLELKNLVEAIKKARANEISTA